VLHKFYTNKEAEIDLDLPELQQQSALQPQQATSTKRKSNGITKSASSASLLNSADSRLEVGFNPFAANDSRFINKSNANGNGGLDPDWAKRMMDTYLPGLLENGAKFNLALSIIKESVLIGDKILLFSQSLLTLDLFERYISELLVPNTKDKWEKNKSYFRM
jgi:RAD54-like protein 2